MLNYLLTWFVNWLVIWNTRLNGFKDSNKKKVAWNNISSSLDNKYSGEPMFSLANEMLFNWRHFLKSVQMGSFFWSVFSRFRTEYGEIQSISSYSVRMRENTDQKNSVFGHYSRSEIYFIVLVSFNLPSR